MARPLPLLETPDLSSEVANNIQQSAEFGIGGLDVAHLEFKLN